MVGLFFFCGNDLMTFDNLITQIRDIEPSWERTEQIEQLIHILNKEPGILKHRWSFLLSEGYNWWTAWDGHGWEFIWKRFLIEVGIHWDSLSIEEKEYFSIFDVKEKYGTLRVVIDNRVSLSGYDDKISELESILDHLSSVTCVCCGKQPRDSRGKNLIWLTPGWTTPYCKNCLRKVFFKYRKADKQEFDRYAKECRTVVTNFGSVLIQNNCRTHIYRRPAYNWLETYKEYKE